MQVLDLLLLLCEEEIGFFRWGWMTKRYLLLLNTSPQHQNLYK